MTARRVIRGMTGFGSAVTEGSGRRVVVEIKGVNNRFLDIRIKLPADLPALEADMKKRLQETMARGRVDVTVQTQADPSGGPRVEVREALVADYVAASRRLKRRHRLPGTVTLDRLMSLPGVVQVIAEPPSDPEDLKSAALAGFQEALAGFDGMRRAEGGHLAADLSARLSIVAGLVEQISGDAAHEPARVSARLRERVEMLTAGPSLDPARLAQEVAILAGRVDITEELVRLRGYVGQARGLLDHPEGPVGKTLDFVMQEMNREANTISSKSEALSICQAALQVRSIVEAIREQVQNLE